MRVKQNSDLCIKKYMTFGDFYVNLSRFFFATRIHFLVDPDPAK